MKLSKILTVISALFLVLVISGCSYNGAKIAPKEITNFNNESILLVQSAAPGAPSISRARDGEVAAWYAMQRASEITLDRKDSYFAIALPKLISNVDGSTMNTPEEFAKKCTNSSGASLASAFDAFGFNSYGCNIHSRKTLKSGFLAIITYKKKPKKYLVYNANDVLNYLKKNEMLVSDEDVKEFPAVSDRVLRGLNDWLKNYSEKK